MGTGVQVTPCEGLQETPLVSVDRLASGTGGAQLEGLPSYPFLREASKLPTTSMGGPLEDRGWTGSGAYGDGVHQWGLATPHLKWSGLCNSPVGQRGSLWRPHERRA